MPPHTLSDDPPRDGDAPPSAGVVPASSGQDQHRWDDDSLDGWGPRFRLSRWSRLWLPVIISFLVQVPPAVALWRHRDLPLWGEAEPLQLGVGVAVAAVGPLALIGARRFPGPVVAVVAAASAVDLFIGADRFAPPYLALAFAILSAVMRGARLWAWLSVAIAWVLALVAAALTGAQVQPGRAAATTLGVLIVFGIAESGRARRERLGEVRRRIAERREKELQAERVRIARELHDVLAHSLSQINVQAGVGLHLIDRQPEKARDALASIRESSKTALDEVRSVLGILRAEHGADPSAPLVPEPDLSRLPGLAATTTAHGVEVRLADETREVPKPVQLALYRIAQESLTNIVRHARASHARVTLTESDAAYRLEVVDDGPAKTPISAADGGRGLLGMRERAELLGGRLDAGPRPGGGFAVTATIPKERA